jgi:membrane-bound inhibitor of C-type lysozyme
VKVGDLVRYISDAGVGTSLRQDDDQLGIVTALGVSGARKPECYVVWWTCANQGWWNAENLEVLSESR